MDAFTLRPSADALSLGIGWDTMGPTGMNIGVGGGGPDRVIGRSGDLVIGKDKTSPADQHG
jgi:hypothetical protein